MEPGYSRTCIGSGQDLDGLGNELEHAVAQQRLRAQAAGTQTVRSQAEHVCHLGPELRLPLPRLRALLPRAIAYLAQNLMVSGRATIVDCLCDILLRVALICKRGSM